jgi:hypothetical protein
VIVAQKIICMLPHKPIYNGPIKVAARSKAWNVYALSSTGIMGSNPVEGTDVWLLLLSLCCPVLVAVLRRTDIPVQVVLPTVYSSGLEPREACPWDCAKTFYGVYQIEKIISFRDKHWMIRAKIRVRERRTGYNNI